MTEFEMSGENMSSVMVNLNKAKEYVEGSYAQLNQVLTQITTEQMWKGEQTQTFLAYMELLREYHKAFTDHCEQNPLQEAIAALDSFLDKIDSFYMDFPEYTNLEGVE